MATKIMSSNNHTQMMKKIKLPKLASQQARVMSSCFSSSTSFSFSSSHNHSLKSGISSFSSPCSVLPQGFKSKKKRPLSPQPLWADQREVKKSKKMKVVESSSSTAASTPRMSPTELRQAMVKIKFAKDIYEAQNQHLEEIITDPVELRKELAELRRKELDLKARVEAQLREEKRMADLEAKRKQEEFEKERQLMIQRQRRRERSARNRMEAVAKSKLKQPYSCSLKEFRFMTQCDYACSWSIMGGQHPSPLELVGLRIKEQGENQCDLREVELEEGEIVDELEEGGIR